VDHPEDRLPAEQLAHALILRGMMLAEMAFLILHGLEGSGPEHWQTWLAGRLRERGLEVAYPSLPDAAVQLNDRLDRYGRLLVTRDLARWGADLEMNQRRIELIRQKDAKTYARMIQGRHAGGTAIIAKLAEEMEAESEGTWGSSRGGRRGDL